MVKDRFCGIFRFYKKKELSFLVKISENQKKIFIEKNHFFHRKELIKKNSPEILKENFGMTEYFRNKSFIAERKFCCNPRR